MADFVCAGCSAELEERQLSMTYIVTERCPRCRAVVRQGDGFRYGNPQVQIAEDVESIGVWLTEEAESLHLEICQIRDDENKGEFRWKVSGPILAGCSDGWGIEAFYSANCPGVFSVKIVITEPRMLAEDEPPVYVAVLKDHGLQFHGSQTSGTSLGVYREEARWGALQHLSTNSNLLPQGLLRPLFSRMLAAMRDVITTREKRKP